MLPQPNFGPASQPGGDDDEAERPPKQLGRLRIVMWVQTLFAVLAGNLLIVNLLAVRQSDYDELVESRTDLYLESDFARADAEAAAIADADYFHGATYMTTTIALASLLIIAAVVSALCAVRLKSRLKSVRRVAIAATIVLLLLAMFATISSPNLFIALMFWVFASILALWWLFAADVKYWMSEKAG